MLSALSLLLEAGRPVLTADEVASLGTVGDALAGQKILVPTRPATHIACDACHEDHVEEVTRTKSGSGDTEYRIPCPDAGWTAVVRERLQQWTVDVRRLVSFLAEGAGQGGSVEEIVASSAWRIGNVIIADEHYGLVFVLNPVSADPAVFDRVAKKSPAGRTVVIIGCGLPDEAEGFAGVLSLASAFEFRERRFELQIERVRATVSSGPGVRGNVFYRRGEFWEIAFEGKTIYLKDTVGLGYIARLLMTPGRTIPAVTLLAARTGIDPLVATGSSGEMIDEQARADYKRRYQELTDDLEEAKELNDHATIEKLEGEMEQLTTLLAAAIGIGGRGRQITDADKVRKSVSMAVSRDITRIEHEHERLGRHLDTFISSGLTFCYAPEPAVAWTT